MSTSVAYPSHPQRVLADIIPETLLTDIALIVGAACLVGILAQISFPLGFTPVPVTGQTLGVVLAGSALGWRRAGLSMVLYVAVGSLGVPWFAHHTSGWSNVSGATGGYLVGFIAAGALCGWLASRGGDRTMVRAVPSMIIGNAVIYAFGVSWLAHSIHVSLGKAISLGLTPFLWGDGLKVVIAAMVLPGAWHLVGRTKGSSTN